MSLINDALKKAARQRAEAESNLDQLMPGTSRHGSQGGKRNSTQMYVLIGAAAVVLVVVSVVATGIFVAKPAPPTQVAARQPADTTPPPTSPGVQVPAVPLVSIPRTVPAVQTPVAVAEERPVPTTAPTAVPTAEPTAAPVAMPAAAPTAVPFITLHPPEPAAPVASTPGAQTHNDLVQGLVDRLQVSGVRASGAASKALVDGHVYRMNDVLDRTTGLKLVGVDPDHLTFVDSAGVTYVKSF